MIQDGAEQISLTTRLLFLINSPNQDALASFNCSFHIDEQIRDGANADSVAIKERTALMIHYISRGLTTRQRKEKAKSFYASRKS